MEQERVKRIIEAALLAANQPLSLAQLGALFGEGEAVAREGVAQALTSLAADCEGRGIELVEVASGFRYQIRSDVHPWVTRMWTERQTRYSRALLETLALIAYRQPITRAEIEQIRGVAVSASIMRTLEEREWVRVVGHRDVPGRPALFGTTRQFLDYFGLRSLDELPPLAEIRDLDDLEPQLDLVDDGTAQPAPAPTPTEPADAAPLANATTRTAALANVVAAARSAEAATPANEASAQDAMHDPSHTNRVDAPPADTPEIPAGDDASRVTPENLP